LASDFSSEFAKLSAVARYLHLVMIAHHLLPHLAMERLVPPAQQPGEKAVTQGRDTLRLPGVVALVASVERMQSVLRALLFDDCVTSLTTGKKDKALGRKLKKMLVPVE